MLRSYYGEYAAIAAAAEAGLLVETPTWRANPDWGTSSATTRRAGPGQPRRRCACTRRRRRGAGANRAVSGIVGPRGDGYVAAGADADEAADYHSAQVRSFAAEGVDLVHAMTMTEPAEAMGVVRAARARTSPSRSRSPSRPMGGFRTAPRCAAADRRSRGRRRGRLVRRELRASHSRPGAPIDGAPATAAEFFRPNASTMSHEELDAMEVLDAGDLDLLVDSTKSLREQTRSSPCSADAAAPTAVTSLRCGAYPRPAEHLGPHTAHHSSNICSILWPWGSSIDPRVSSRTVATP